jgi:type IV pilus assembly protein PilB
MIHVGDPRHYESLPPVGKLIALVFAMVGKDRATELRFDHHKDPAECRMWYRVEGAMYEMVPPPTHIWPDLFGRLWSATRLDPADRPPWWRRLRRPAFPETPARGTLTVRFGNVPVEFDILFFRGRAGEHIQLHLTRPLDVSNVSCEFMSQVLARRGTIDL